VQVEQRAQRAGIELDFERALPAQGPPQNVTGQQHGQHDQTVEGHDALAVFARQQFRVQLEQRVDPAFGLAARAGVGIEVDQAVPGGAVHQYSERFIGWLGLLQLSWYAKVGI